MRGSKEHGDAPEQQLADERASAWQDSSADGSSERLAIHGPNATRHVVQRESKEGCTNGDEVRCAPPNHGQRIRTYAAGSFHGGGSQAVPRPWAWAHGSSGRCR